MALAGIIIGENEIEVKSMTACGGRVKGEDSKMSESLRLGNGWLARALKESHVEGSMKC